MNIQFKNGFILDIEQINEDKRIYSVPQKWELKISSKVELSSAELDSLLTADNVSELLYTKSDQTTAYITGYSFVDRISKTVSDTGVTLIIVLQKDVIDKEETNDES